MVQCLIQPSFISDYVQIHFTGFLYTMVKLTLKGKISEILLRLAFLWLEAITLFNREICVTGSFLNTYEVTGK